MSLLRVITHLLCHALHSVKEQWAYLSDPLSRTDASTLRERMAPTHRENFSRR